MLSGQAMLRALVLWAAVLSLAACFGPAKFDASSEQSIQRSGAKMAESIPEGKREEFAAALMYFTLGGPGGEMSIFSTLLSGKPQSLTVNLQAIHGLTADEIIAKHQQAMLEHKRLAQQREAVESASKAAEALLKDRKFEEALAKYQAIRSLPTGAEAADQGIAKATTEMREFTERMGYIDKIELTAFEARRIDTYSDKRVPAIRFGLKNRGDRSLDKVKVVVYFQDKNGATIFEEDFHPILVSTYSIRDNKPLKPGYTWEMERGKFYTIDSQLSEWATGKAVAKIVDIAFSDSANEN